LIDDSIHVSGYIYSVRTGGLDQVVAPTTAAAAAKA